MTATTAGTGLTERITLRVDGVRESAQPTEGLFRVQVDGLLGFTLVPLTDLARDLAGAWLAGEAKRSLLYVGQTADGRHRVRHLSFRIETPPLLTDGGDPFMHGEQLNPETRTIAKAAVDAHWVAKRPVRKPKRKASKRGAK